MQRNTNVGPPTFALHVTEHCVIVKLWRIVLLTYVDPPLVGAAWLRNGGDMRQHKAKLWEPK